MEAYEKSVDLYGRGAYLEAFHSLLDYLNAGFRSKYGNAEGTEFHIPHGSILVHIRLADNTVSVVADFLRLPRKGRVAMLRQVADLNLNKLLLPRFVKEGEQLKMEYLCPLSQSHPHKMFYVLQNICHIGDKYDDEFCTRFGATRCYEPRVTPYPPEEVERIHEAIQTVGKATLEALKEYDGDRRYGYSWNVLDTAFYQISYFARPQGQLLNDLEKAVDDLDAERPIVEVLAKGKAFLEKLLATPREKLAEDLYYTDTLVSTKRRSSLKSVQEHFRSVYQEAAEAMQSDNYGAVPCVCSTPSTRLTSTTTCRTTSTASCPRPSRRRANRRWRRRRKSSMRRWTASWTATWTMTSCPTSPAWKCRRAAKTLPKPCSSRWQWPCRCSNRCIRPWQATTCSSCSSRWPQP